jgi:hypothetical protein
MGKAENVFNAQWWTAAGNDRTLVNENAVFD